MFLVLKIVVIILLGKYFVKHQLTSGAVPYMLRVISMLIRV
jgi:hypothetical protein